MTSEINLSFKEAVIITSILKELGHPKGPFGDQHLLTSACTLISERTMIPREEIMDALCETIGKLQQFVDQESDNQLEIAKRRAH